MAQVTRSTKVSGGTTLVSNTVARAADVETDMLTLFSAHNNHDTGASKWTVVSALNASGVPLTADNSSGSSDVFDAKVNGVIKVSVDSTGNLQVVNSTATTNLTALLARIAQYRRPVLQFGSVTTVAVESGLDGTSGNIPILFPDGSIRTETSTTRTTFNITRNTVLTTSGAQSGLRSSLSEAANTWYALYAVKVTDSSTLWCTVGDTVLPLQANYATLNSNFGTAGWVCLGLIRNGDNSGATSDILDFVQCGNITLFKNTLTCTLSGVGTLLASATATTSAPYTYAAGTGTTSIPNNISLALYQGTADTNPGQVSLVNRSGNRYRSRLTTSTRHVVNSWFPAVEGVSIETVNSVNQDVSLAGFVDGALGIGLSPLL